MSSARELTEYFVDQLRPLGGIEIRPFFGGWALVLDGRQFAMVIDTLYFCVDERTRPAYVAAGSVPFAYERRTLRVQVSRYYSAPAEAIDDGVSLCALAREALTVTPGR